jgi:hypothetical protein
MYIFRVFTHRGVGGGMMVSDVPTRGGRMNILNEKVQCSAPTNDK